MSDLIWSHQDSSKIPRFVVGGMASNRPWTMLEFDSLNALRHEPSTNNHAIRLEADLGDAEISGSAVTANALICFDEQPRQVD